MRRGGKTFDESEVFDVKNGDSTNANYDQSKFFNSFYAVDSRGDFDDRSTIGHMVTRACSRFHYNAVENGIIRAIAHREPPPYGDTVRVWEFAQERRDLCLLDVGSGTGHWIDFFMDAQYVLEAVGVEVAPNISKFLLDKYAGDDRVEILKLDIASAELHEQPIAGPFDYISAIGVLFHITDDEKWLRALANLKSLLAPDGLMFIGGDFGAMTRNLQFHRVDDFDDWHAQKLKGNTEAVFVNKRVRSLGDWHTAANSVGLQIADLIRVDSDWAIYTPENDLLVLKHAASAAEAPNSSL